MTIEGIGIKELAELSAELTKNGVNYKAVLHENNSWTIVMTGGF